MDLRRWGAVDDVGSAPRQGDLLRSTVNYCQGRVPEDSIYAVLHRECFNLFPDELFADLFTDVGRRSVPPMIVAVVMVLQRIEGCSDREAVDRFAFDARPLDVPIALTIGKGTVRKMRQNLTWAIGYNVIALPIAAGVFYPAFGIRLSPEIAAISMAGSSVIVAVNALLLKRLRLPEQGDAAGSAKRSQPLPEPSGVR